MTTRTIQVVGVGGIVALLALAWVINRARNTPNDRATVSAVAVAAAVPVVATPIVPIDAPPVDAGTDAHLATKEEIARPKIVAALEKIDKARGIQAPVKLYDDDTTIAIDAPITQCDARVLLGLRRELVALKLDPASGFDKMSCGEMGDEIDLHTKDGCAPNQEDQLIISDAGVRRNAYADGMTKIVGNGLLIIANGCDAKRLEFAAITGAIEDCGASLRRVLGEIREQLIRLGFTQMRCVSDGTTLDIR